MSTCEQCVPDNRTCCCVMCYVLQDCKQLKAKVSQEMEIARLQHVNCNLKAALYQDTTYFESWALVNPVGGGQSGGHVYTWQLWASAESLYTAGALAYSGMWSRGVAGGSPTVPFPLLPLSPPLRLLTDVPGYNTRKFFGNRRTFWTLKLWTTFSKLSNFN